MYGLCGHLAVTHHVSANAPHWHDEVLKSSTSLVTACTSLTNSPYNFIPSILLSPTTSLRPLPSVVSHLRTVPMIPESLEDSLPGEDYKTDTRFKFTS
jgi:hypothetical protein